MKSRNRSNTNNEKDYTNKRKENDNSIGHSETRGRYISE